MRKVLTFCSVLRAGFAPCRLFRIQSSLRRTASFVAEKRGMPYQPLGPEDGRIGADLPAGMGKALSRKDWLSSNKCHKHAVATPIDKSFPSSSRMKTGLPVKIAGTARPTA